VVAKVPEFVADPVALLVVDLWIRCWLDSRIGTRGCRLETGAANVKIFLEAIELEEVGEFECADISALCTDLLLEIGDHALQVFSAEAGAKELIPEPFAIEAQAKSLSGPVAVKLMEFAHRFGAVFCVLA
jgi:hypothetical protein